MHLRGHLGAGFGSPVWVRRITVVVAAGLLLGTVDLHALVHHRQNLAQEILAASHPEPVHLDTYASSHELPCLACTAGLKNQGRLASAMWAIAAPADCGSGAAVGSGAGVGGRPCRLPLSRAPPRS